LETAVQNSARLAAAPENFPGLPKNLLRDPAVRYGLKFGFAGVLAVYISLVIRLDNPGWALFTVFVLMVAQYVGAISEKSIFRLIGTLVGGILGYLLTGSLEQEPILFLGLIGLVVGGCTALFGQSRYPYAFLLCGMTTMVVASNGMGDPAASWTFMVSRIEEIFVGIVVTLVVQSVLWPRYARVEFLESVRGLFGDLRGCFLDAPGIRNDRQASGEVRAEDFPARITGLRTLLEFGARESLYFRRKLIYYYELTGCLGKIAYAIGTLRAKIPADSLYRQHAGAEVDAVYAEIAGALADLEDPASSEASRARARQAMDRAFGTLEGAFLDMRARDQVRAIPAAQAMVLGLHVLGLDEIRTQIVRAHEVLNAAVDGAIEKSPPSAAAPWPPPFWIKTGVKSGLALVAALILDNWLHPPGGPMFVLGSWAFTAMNAASPGGQGDRRAFHLIPLNVVALAALSMGILVARPMLSSYAVMNVIIFCWLFVWGYQSFATRGMTIPMQIGMLVAVGILGLNGQEPVSVQSVANLFFGLVLGLVVSAIFQRLLWPSLPQWETRDRFIAMIGICRRLLAREPTPPWIQTRLSLIPGEVDVRLGHLTAPICPEGEQEKLRDLMKTLARLGGNFSVTLDRFPVPQAADGRAAIARIEALLADGLAALQSGFSNGADVRVDEAGIRLAVQNLSDWLARTRMEMVEAGSPPLTNARLAGFAKRYALMADDLVAAGRQFSGLSLPLYMGDFSL